VYVDLEHTAITSETAAMLCLAARGSGVVPLVRVPSQLSEHLTRALDTGAAGVIVPHIESAAEAQNVVDACRFPPGGRRSVIGMSPTTGYRPMGIGAAADLIQSEVCIGVMLESPGAIASADEIARIDGIDLLLIGAYDLTAEMDTLGDFQNTEFLAAIDAASAASRKHGTLLGIAGISDIELLTELVRKGVRFISAGTDAALMMEAGRGRVSSLRNLPIQSKEDVDDDRY
jgi:4-hydroxy-2-oxoheptanedioate aldolase